MTRLRGLLLLSVVILVTALSSWAAVFVSVAIGPPALRVYSQPLIPGPGYIWTPGYWAYGPDGYYWVPGTWVLPPQVGFLWTPGYWGFSAGLYNWYPGYWGPVVGFYGGINYGFGYTGFGYFGGYWHGRDFYYNRAVNNVNVTNIHNVYNQRVVNNVSRVSYNGGRGGIQARATSQQLAARQDPHHIGPTSAQVRQEQAARGDRAQFASANHGRLAVAATPRPGAFNTHDAARVNQPAMNRPTTTTANAASNARQVPRPPENNHQARTSENVPRPPQNNLQPRASQNVSRPSSNQQQARSNGNVPRPSNHSQQPVAQARNVQRPATMQRPAAPQHQARHANNAPRQSAPQNRVASRPPSQRPAIQPHQAAAQRPSGGGHQQSRPR